MLSSAAITPILTKQYPYASAMSKHTIQFETIPANGHSAFTNLHLLQFILENTEITLLREAPLSQGTEFFSLKDPSDFYELKNGLDFTNNDMLKGANKIVLSKTLLDSQPIHTNWYSHEGMNYEIIGVYQSGVSRYYVPLISVLKNAPDLPATGTFYLDGADNTTAIFEKLKAYIASIDATTSVSSRQALSGVLPSSDLKALFLLLAWIGAAAGILCASLCLKYRLFLLEPPAWEQCMVMTGAGLGITLLIGVLLCILTVRQTIKHSNHVEKIQ